MLNYSFFTEIVSSTKCIFQTIDIDKLHCINKLINSSEKIATHKRDWSTTQWVRSLCTPHNSMGKERRVPNVANVRELCATLDTTVSSRPKRFSILTNSNLILISNLC